MEGPPRRLALRDKNPADALIDVSDNCPESLRRRSVHRRLGRHLQAALWLGGCVWNATLVTGRRISLRISNARVNQIPLPSWPDSSEFQCRNWRRNDCHGFAA